MPSLRQKVTTYFRQLSFIAEPRDVHGQRGSKAKDEEDGNFIIKYLEGRMERIFVPAPEVQSGQNPTDLPDLKLATYLTNTNNNTIIAACTGPDEGLTGIKRSKLHLSASFADDIDFIDTITDADCLDVRSSTTTTPNIRNQNNKLNRLNKQLTQTSDQNANKTNNALIRSRRNSKTSLTNLNQTSTSTSTTTTATVTTATSTTTTTQANTKKYNSYTNTKDAFMRKTQTQLKTEENANNTTTPTKTIETSTTTTEKQPATIVVSMVSTKPSVVPLDNDQNNKNLINTKPTTTTLKTDSSTGIKRQTKDSNEIENENENKENSLHINESNQTNSSISGLQLMETSIAGVSNWKMAADYAYGISVSLYETNQLTKESTGNPIADCYGLVVRENAALMALADGVNWGDGARLAARSAVHGCLDYLDRAIFGLTNEMTSTQEVFVSLLRSLWEGHGCILEVGGALSTLTVAVVLPLEVNNSTVEANQQKYVVCACNVGDSLGYVYSKKHGVREFTQASHDITSMRDMRDALGALGPADGNKPELSNLTFSMTIIEHGDIVFLTSDGISDNFDPVVGKFAEAWTPDVKILTKPTSHTQNNILAPKRQNKSSSAIYNRLHATTTPVPMPRQKKVNSVNTNESIHSRPKYMRSHTVIEPRRPSTQSQLVQKTTSGLPLVTAAQRHALTLYRLEDLLSYGINGTFCPCVSARRLCHLLIDFVRMITSARRKTLEQRELFYKLSTSADGVRREVELNRMQHRAARKRIIDTTAFAALPGKLDHATVVAYTVGGGDKTTNKRNTVVTLQSKEFKETNF